MPSQKRLLILDDEAIVAKTIAAMAETSGFETRISATPEEMFQLVDEWAPSHIAIDLVMPDMDGVEVLRALAEMRCTAAILVMSGMGMKVLESAQKSAEVRGLRIAGLLPKPFQAQALRELLGATAAQDKTRSISQSHVAKETITEDDLIVALQDDQFILHYQPKIRLVDAEVVGCEAVVRWQHPKRGLVFPDSFIPLAEKSGTIVPMTYRIFDAGLEWLKDVDAPISLSLAVNLSAISFTDLALADRLHAACLRFKVPPQRISLELTETSAMDGSAVAFDVLTRLRIKGFSLGIDDFGTGYSSMAQLAHLPFSELKIDRSFVMSMLSSKESRTIVESTILLAKRMELTTVAEGVEDAETMRALKDLGCDIAQGYHFAQPMHGEDMMRWLGDWDPSRIA